ncbi:MAG: hypothetical protein HY563_06545, partial [Ignavibacteriales bacterium]|nr:hypothetical protein [Ignavibacteriales bacterium]
KVEAFAPNARKIHIDIDPSSINKNVRVDAPLVGDVRGVLSALLDLVSPLDTTDWLETIEQWKREHPLRYKQCDVLRAQYILHELGEVTGGNAIVVTDVGQHQMWAAQFFTWVHPRSHITSGGLGTMGFSLPAAMGAAIGRSDLPVVSISGDGGFQMNMQELATIVDHKLPMKIFIINNGFLGMVRQWQELFYRRRYSHVDITSPDFVKLAEAFGCPGRRVTRPDEVHDAILEAIEYSDGPMLVEFVVAKEDNVYPMIPAGQTVDEMLDVPGDNGNGLGDGTRFLAKGARQKVSLMNEVKT